MDEFTYKENYEQEIYCSVKQTGSKASWNKYITLRNKVTSLMRTAEANYWKQQFANTKSSKDFWRLVGKLTY